MQLWNVTSRCKVYFPNFGNHYSVNLQEIERNHLHFNKKRHTCYYMVSSPMKKHHLLIVEEVYLVLNHDKKWHFSNREKRNIEGESRIFYLETLCRN